MTRISNRRLERALRAPAPPPPEDLGQKLKDQIPAEILGAGAAEPGSTARGRGRVALALAASVLVAIGSSYLAVRLYGVRGGADAELERAAAKSAAPPLATEAGPGRRSAEPQADADADAAIAEEALAPRPAAEIPPPAAQPDPDGSGRPSARPASEPAPPVVAAAPAPGARESAPGEPVAPVALADEVAERRTAGAREIAANVAAPQPARSGAAPGTGDEPDRRRRVDHQTSIEQLQAERERLERELEALPGTGREERAEATAPRVTFAPAAGGLEPRPAELERRRAAIPAEARPERVERRAAAGRGDALGRGGAGAAGSAFLDTATQPRSTLAVTIDDRDLAAAVSGDLTSDPAVGIGGGPPVPLEALLDLAATRAGRVHGGAVLLAAAPLPAPGRVAVLVSAEIVATEASSTATEEPRALQLELDPGEASRYRLLASHAHTLAPSPGGGPPRYRLSALFEIERAAGASRDSALGRVELRPPKTSDRAAGAADGAVLGATLVAPTWSSASPELRLAVLAARLQEADPPAAGTIAAEVERVLASGALDRDSERLGAELLAAAGARADRR